MIFENHPSPRKLSDHHNLELVEHFLDELKTVYGIGKSLLDILGKYQHIAIDEFFIKLLVRNSNVYSKNIERLDEVFLLIDTPISTRNKPILKSLLEESKEISNRSKSSMLDLKISLYTIHSNLILIAIYDQLATLSEKMNMYSVAILFNDCIEDSLLINKTLEEYYKTDMMNTLISGT